MPRFRLPIWYVYCFISEFVLIYPTYLIMMESAGIDAVGVATLLTIWSLATLLFELPTGVIADLVPRKHLMLLAGLLDAVAFLCWLSWPEFWGFALGFVIWSLAGALASGTSEAYLYEVLDDPHGYQRVYGRTEAAESIGIASALFLGGFAASGGFELVLLVSAAGPLAGVALLYFLVPDAPVAAPTATATATNSFRLTLKHGLRRITQQRHLALVMLIAAALAAMAGVYEEYAGVLLREIEFSLALIGIIYAGIWLARAAGAVLAERISNRTLPLLAFTVASVFLLLTTGAPGWLLVAGLLLFFASSAAVDVVYGAYLQQLLTDDVRATVTSVQSLSTEALAAVLFLLAGFVAVDASWLTAAWWMALLAVTLGLLATTVAGIYLAQPRVDVE